jgi:GT2 family glycosyltransferase
MNIHFNDINKNNNSPEVAIVILNWNGSAFLQQFLPSVLGSTYSNKRIIVADNASTDDSIEVLQQLFPTVEIIQHQTNEGFAKGYNSALKKVQSDYYVLLNSDVEVTENWIEPIVALMESNHAIAACAPKLLAFHDRHSFEYAGASGGWLDHLGYPFARGRVFDTVEQDQGQFNDAMPCAWASGAALFVKAESYHALGGLDEYFFAHQEEIDFCWRLQLAGYQVYVQPESIVYHVGGGTLPKTNHHKTYLNFRNNLIMLAKNLPIAKAIYTISIRLALDALAAYRELSAGRGGGFLAIAKAHFHFLHWCLWGRKKSVFPKRRGVPAYGWIKTSLVWKYFFNNKKTFLEIIAHK